MVDSGLLVQSAPALAPGDPVEVRVLKTTQASIDHLTLREFKAGESYRLPAWLASVFIREGWGVFPDASPVFGPTEAKVTGPESFKRGRRARRA